MKEPIVSFLRTMKNQSYTHHIPMFLISVVSVLFFIGSLYFSGAVLADFTDNSNNAEGFGGATHYGTSWDAGNSWVEITTTTNVWEFPNSKSATGWIDMSNNVALYHLNESAGAITATDSSGNGHNGTITGTTMGASARMYTGGSFDGSDKITVSDADAFSIDTTMDLSASFWVKTGSSVTTRQALLSKGAIDSAANWEWQIYIKDGVINAWYGSSDGTTTRYESSSAISINTWYHVVVVFTGSGSSDDILIYVNGVEVSTGGGTGAGSYGNSTQGFAMGIGYGGGAANQLTGSLDEVAIFNDQLTATEVTTIYNRQSPNYAGYFDSRIMDAAGLSSWDTLSWVPYAPYAKELPDSMATETAYTAGNINMGTNNLLLHFNETSGTTAADTSGSSYNGTVNGGSTVGVSGLFNKGIKFGGVNGYVSLPSQPVSNIFADTFTISFWVHPGTTADRPTFGFSINTDNVKDNPIASWDTGFYIGDGQNYRQLSLLPVAEANKWTHYAIVDDGTNYKTYVNGAEISSTAINNVHPGNASNLQFLIGQSGFSSEQYKSWFNGTFDEFAIFRTGFSAAEIANLYKRGVARVGYQVRSCDDASCSGEVFQGPDGTRLTYFTESTTTTAGLPSKSLSVTDNRYFQYRAVLDTLDIAKTVELKSVTVANTAGAGVTLSATTASATEGGATGSYTIVLDSQPTDTVTVALSASNSQVTLSTSSIAFTTSNWSTPVTVTVTASDDSAYESTHTSIISHTATSNDANYNNIAISNVTVTITDNEIAADDLLDDDNSSAGGFGAGTHTNTQWDSNNAWLEMDATGLTNGSATFTSRIFDGSATSNWGPLTWVPNAPYGKELPNSKAVESAYTTGNINMTNNTLLLHLNESSGSISDTSGNNAALTASDVTYGATGKFNTAVTFNGTSSDLFTDNNSDSFLSASTKTISLWVYPTGSAPSVANSYAGHRLAGNDSGYSSAARYFGLYRANIGGQDKIWAYNWDGTEDNVGVTYSANEWAHIVMVHSGGIMSIYKNGILVDSVASGDTTLMGSSLRFGSQSFTGSLDEIAVFNTALSATDILNIYKRGALNLKFQAQTCDDSACSGETTWQGPTGVADDVISELDSSTTTTPSIALSGLSASRYFRYRSIFETSSSTLSPELFSVSLATTSANVGVTLNTGTGVTATEGGSTGSYTVVLNTRPTDTVTVTVSHDADVSLSATTLTFTTDNYNTPQTVTVTAVDDGNFEGEETGTITHTASSNDANYSGISISDVSVTVTDNDTATTDLLDDDNSTYGFGGGTTSSVQWDALNGWLEISSGTSGTFTSRIFNGGTVVKWNTFAWVPRSPYGKELPNSKAVETAYAAGNIDMSNNVALYHLNEANGATTFTESSGNSYNLTCSGAACPTAGGSGKFSTSLSFDGADVASNSSVPFLSTFTLAAWFNVDSSQVSDSKYRSFISRGGVFEANTNYAFGYRKRQDNGVSQIFLNYQNGSTSYGREYDLTGDPRGSWQHAVATFDGATRELKLYYNGQLIVTETMGAVPTDGTQPFKLGAPNTFTSNDQYFFGKLDEVAVFSSVLSATDVLNMYKRGALNIKHQFRTCDDNACSGESFVDADGTVGTYATELDNSTTGTPSISLSLGNNQYFQYQTTFETSSSTLSPELTSVTLTTTTPPGITLSATTTSATEGGATGSYTVVLDSQPSADVTISLTASNSEISLSAGTLTFTSSNWSTPQTITITAVDDTKGDGDLTSTITHAASSADSNYNGLSVSSVAVTVSDNDIVQNDLLDDGNTSSGFGGGTTSSVQWDAGNSWLELDANGLTAGSGNFTSRILDAGSSQTWGRISWVPHGPFLKPLPNSGGVEIAYTTGNVSMANNVLLLHFDQSSGATTFTDSSGFGYSATCSGDTCPTSGATGKFSNAVTLDSTDDVVEITDQTSFDGGSALSGAYWVNISSLSTYDTMVKKWASSANTTPNSWMIRADNTANDEMIVLIANGSADSGSNFCITTDANLTAGSWTHIAFVFNGSGSTNAERLQVYKNGAPVTCSFTGTIPSTMQNTAHNVQIGGSISSSSVGPLGGTYDELAIWTRALSASEVLSMYRRGALELKFQVRSCDDNACSGETFVGPDGTASTYYTEATTSTLGLPQKTLTHVSNNRYFQYKAFFTSASTTESPELVSVTMSTGTPNTVPTASLGVPSQTSASVVTVTSTVSDTNNDTTSLTVQYSTDGSTWNNATLGTVTQTSGEGTVSTGAGSITGIDTNVDGSVNLSIEWNIATDLPSTDDTTVYLRIVPNDGTDTGETANSSAFAVDTAAPTAPGNLTISSTSTQSVTFAFGAQSSDTNFSEYVIYYKAGSSGVAETDTAFGSSSDADLASASYNGTLTTTLTGLATSTQYVAKIFAYDSFNNGAGSAGEIAFYTLAATPAAPTVTAASTASTTLTLVINANTNPAAVTYSLCKTDDGTTCAANGYVQADGSLGASAVWQTRVNWGGDTGVSVAGLTANTAYQFLVKARNGDNVETSLSSANAAVYTAPAQADAPTLSNATSSTIDIAITDTDATHGNTFAIYDSTNSWYIAADGSATLTPVFQTKAAWATATVTGLNPNVAYSFLAVGRNPDGVTGTTSTAATLYTLAKAAGTPTVANPTVSTLDITIDVNGNPADTTYAIYNSTTGNYVAADGSSTASAVFRTSAAWDTPTVSGLSVNTAYQFAVIARNGDNVNAATSTASTAVYTLANQASAPTVTVGTTSTLSLAINANSNPAHTTFAIYNSTDGTYVAADGSSTGSAVYQAAAVWDTVTLSGLSINTAYQMSVIARNGDNINAATSTASAAVYTLANPSGTVTVNGASTTTLGVTFGTNSNPAATQFAIYETNNALYLAADLHLNSETPVWQTAGVWNLPLATANMATNTQYCFAVVARNGDSVNTATTTADCLYTLAAVPTSVTASAGSATAVTVTWGASGNPAGTSYYVVDATDATRNSGWTNETSYTFTGLSASTAYTFKVKARNGDSVETGYSSTASATTQAAISSDSDEEANSGGGAPLPSISIPIPVSLNVNPVEIRLDAGVDIRSATSTEVLELLTQKDPIERTGLPVDGHIIHGQFTAGQGITIKVGPQLHSLILRSIEENIGRFTLFSTPLDITLQEGQEALVDTNADTIADLHIRLRSVDATQNKAETIVTVLSDLPVLINENVSFTNTSTVTLRIKEIQNVSQIAVSEDPSFDGVVFEPYVREKQFTFSPKPGKKTVYVRFRANNGATADASANILLTTVAPSVVHLKSQVSGCLLTPGNAYKLAKDPGVYLITDTCTKQAMRNPSIFFSYFSSWNDVRVTSVTILEIIPFDAVRFAPRGPRHEPQSGTVFKSVSDPRVYLFLQSRKHWISSGGVFTGLKYAWNWIEDVSQSLLNRFEDAEPIQETTNHPEGSVIKYEHSPALYLLEKDGAGVLRKRYIENEVAFRSLNYRADRIITVDQSEQYPDGEIMRDVSSKNAEGIVNVEDVFQKALLSRSLSLGSKGDDVKHLQRILRTLGFFTHPEDTGYFGLETQEAVKAFQKSKGIDPVGIVGPKTIQALLAE